MERWERRGGGGRTPKEAGNGAMCAAYPTLLLSHPLPLTRTGCLHFSYTHSAHSQCDQRRLPGVQTFTLNHHCSFLSLIPRPSVQYTHVSTTRRAWNKTSHSFIFTENVSLHNNYFTSSLQHSILPSSFLCGCPRHECYCLHTQCTECCSVPSNGTNTQIRKTTKYM